MKCQHCEKNMATTHIKRIINGDVTELHICGECAKSMGHTPFSALLPFDLLGSFFKEDTVLLKELEAEEVKRCEGCGSSFSEIAQCGHAGCPMCYSCFFDKLIPTIRRVHGNAKHLGDLPRSAGDNAKKIKNIKALKDKLKNAIDAQDFEQAAIIRDEIKSIGEE